MSRGTVAALVAGLSLGASAYLPTSAIAFGGHGGGMGGGFHGGGMGGFPGGGMGGFHGGGMGAFHGGMGAFRGSTGPNGFVSGRGFAGRHFVGRGFHDHHFFVRDFRHRRFFGPVFALGGWGWGWDWGGSCYAWTPYGYQWIC